MSRSARIPRAVVRFLSRVLRNPVEGVLWYVGMLLARAGYVDAHRAERTTELAWPRIVTGIARMSKSVADLAMVGAVLGSGAVAGIGLATPFAYLAGTLGGGIAGGTIALVSQRFGAEQYGELDLVVKQSVWVTLLLTLPLTVVFFLFPHELIGLIATDPVMHTHGATYLQVMSVGTIFIDLNLIGSRTLVGVDDSYAAMIVRGSGAVANIAFNAVFIFGLGWGVAGAALGSVLANVLVTGLFVYGFLGGRVPFVGRFPVTVSLAGPYFDRSLTRDLVEISTPIIFTNLTWSTAQFPLLAIIAVFGPEVVAAFIVAQRVRGLMDTPNWGLNLASSSLVGQELGKGDELEAGAYGDDILRITLVVYLVIAAAVFSFAEPIAAVFVEPGDSLALTTVFVQVATISVIFNGLNGAASGPLNASGDTRWPLYGRLLGLYGFALPAAFLGTTAVTIPFLGTIPALGIAGLYAALMLETVVPAAVVYYRFSTDRWKVVSRSYRPEAPAAD
ncbi:MATE family efflux transporter [Halobacteria archaeon AArc-m2/3/4]|uniref:Multidrug-efflux transporter n=1 Tax=Natronoglomus mannanivorans TaxID=2979990 RepID=A0ABT2QEB4_9EURY|nr:MATE family efflux transporter [Halobacteria archaeon AArc-m2/3/4]